MHLSRDWKPRYLCKKNLSIKKSERENWQRERGKTLVLGMGNEILMDDGIKTKNGKPGDVYYFTPEDYKETLHLSNVHDVSFLTAIELGESLGYQLPESTLIIAVEIEEDTCFREEFFPKAQ